MPTKRDYIWKAALEIARETEQPDGPTGRYSIPGFTVVDVAERLSETDVDVASRTIRATLNGMVDVGVLAKRAGRSRNFSEYRFRMDHPARYD